MGTCVRTKIVACVIGTLLTSIAATPAVAQSDLGGGLSVTGGVTLVSDYRFRGISQSDKRVALQATASLNHSSGFYATIWGSSIDDYVAYGSDVELDLSAGYRKTYGSTTLDVGVLYYVYPGSSSAGGTHSNFFEPYASVSQAIGPVTAKLTANYAPNQKALTVGNGKEDSLYVAGDLSAAIPKTPISLTAHLGRSFGPSYLTIGDAYTDWGVGASASWKKFVFGLSYVDTNKDFITPSGRNASKAGIVASLGVTF